MKKASTIFDYDLSENEINALKEEFKLSSELTDAAKRISSAYDGKWVWRKGKYYEVSPEEKIDPSDGAFNLYSRTLKITIFFFGNNGAIMFPGRWDAVARDSDFRQYIVSITLAILPLVKSRNAVVSCFPPRRDTYSELQTLSFDEVVSRYIEAGDIKDFKDISNRDSDDTLYRCNV